MWIVLSPIFFFIPSSQDGAYERFISLIMIAWVSLISWQAGSQRTRKAVDISFSPQRDSVLVIKICLVDKEERNKEEKLTAVIKVLVRVHYVSTREVLL